MSMSNLVKEVRDSYTPSKAIYSISTSWNGQGLRLSRTGKPTTNSNMVLCKDLLNDISEKICEDGKHNIDISDLKYRVITAITEDIKLFLQKNLKSANPRLTGLYKWYRDNTSNYANRNAEFADDIAELYQYLFNRNEILTDVDVKNGIGLLKLIYNKYKAK